MFVGSQGIHEVRIFNPWQVRSTPWTPDKHSYESWVQGCDMFGKLLLMKLKT